MAVEKTLKESLAAVAKAGLPPPKYQDGALIRAPLAELVDNPYQPRTSLDAQALDELVGAIRSQGLLQPIAVRPKPDGTLLIVAGHRRVAAFRALQAAASSESERQQYAAIPALVMLALGNAQLAARAYQENVARSALNPLEEAVALERMEAEGLVATVEELSVLTGQPVTRLKRLRRLASAPKVVKDAMSPGVMVVVGEVDGRERRELRRLELATALAFQRLWEYLQKASPKKAEERTGAAVRRSLARNWGKRRVEEYVEAVVAGREAAPEEDGGSGGDEEAALFTRTARRFVILLPSTGTASPTQLGALQAALDEVMAQLSSGRRAPGTPGREASAAGPGGGFSGGFATKPTSTSTPR